MSTDYSAMITAWTGTSAVMKRVRYKVSDRFSSRFRLGEMFSFSIKVVKATKMRKSSQRGKAHFNTFSIRSDIIYHRLIGSATAAADDKQTATPAPLIKQQLTNFQLSRGDLFSRSNTRLNSKLSEIKKFIIPRGRFLLSLSGT